MFNRKALSRDILARFLPNPEAIRAFETMTNLVDDLSPNTIQDVAISSGASNSNAITALIMAESNYAEFSELIAAIDAKNSGLATHAIELANAAYEFVTTLPNFNYLSDEMASIAGVIKEITFADTPYTITNNNETVIVDSTGGNVDINLPSIVLGMYYNVIKSDASGNTVTVNSSDGIIGSGTLVLNAQYESKVLKAGSTEFYVI